MPTDHNKSDVTIDPTTKELALVFGQLKRIGHVFTPSKDLRQSELNMLVHLTYVSPPGTNGIKVSDLGKQLKITSAAVTHVIQSLEQQGYLTRTIGPKDRRSVLVAPTQEGYDFVAAREQELFDRFGQLREHLGTDDAGHLIRILSKSIRFLLTYEDSDVTKP